MFPSNNIVTILGIPSDENSSFLRGPGQAPERIRQILHTGSGNLCAENGMDLAHEPRLEDAGNLTLTHGVKARNQITTAIDKQLTAQQQVLSLGGDHSITFPIIKAYAKHYPNLTILQFDAHPDLYDELDGNRYSHACPFARIMEAGLVKRLVQVGIRTLTPRQREQVTRFGVEVVEMKNWTGELPMKLESPLYLSLDLDALDPAYAPGVSHHEPGGLTTRDVLAVIQNLEAQIVGADIVELNPARDAIDMTAMVAAKFLKEIAAKMLAG